MLRTNREEKQVITLKREERNHRLEKNKGERL